MSPDPPACSRRSLLRTAGVVASVATAGCAATSRTGRPPSESDGESNLPAPTDTEAFTRLEEPDAYELVYRWSLDDRPWELRSTIPKRAVRSAKARSRSIPRCHRAAKTSSAVADLADPLGDDLSTVDSTWDRLRVATRFVQSRTYETDQAATGQMEYPKYAVETLVENGGDCEDVAVLLAGLLTELAAEFDPVLVFFHDHVGIGVDPEAIGEQAEEAADPLVTAGGQSYLFIDATTTLPAGSLPESYDERNVLAIHDGSWRFVDFETLGEYARRALTDGDFVDPRMYL